MKRSEMVNLIAQYLENEFGSISYNSSNKNNGYEQIASDLLTNLESQGMRPPAKFIIEYGDKKHLQFIQQYHNIQIWEPEDEAK